MLPTFLNGIYAQGQLCLYQFSLSPRIKSQNKCMFNKGYSKLSQLNTANNIFKAWRE